MDRTLQDTHEQTCDFGSGRVVWCFHIPCWSIQWKKKKRAKTAWILSSIDWPDNFLSRAVSFVQFTHLHSEFWLNSPQFSLTTRHVPLHRSIFPWWNVRITWNLFHSKRLTISFRLTYRLPILLFSVKSYRTSTRLMLCSSISISSTKKLNRLA